MIEYRSFRNADPPLISAIWSAQAPLRGLIPVARPNFLAEHIFGKPYFDRQGFILALLEGKAIGFAHASFGPTPSGDGLDHQSGVVSLIMIDNHPRATEVAHGLLAACESYLTERGARRISAFGHNHLCPFYLGLYGGTQLPGVLADQAPILEVFLSAGYQQHDRTLILHRDLQQGAIPIDRSQHLLKRSYDIDAAINPPDSSWWEAATLGPFARMQFDLLSRDTETVCGQLFVWDMYPLAKSWNITSAGLVDMNIDPAHLTLDTTRFFIAEVSRYLYRRSISLLEVQHSQGDERAATIFADLGFQQIDEALVLEKSVGG